MNPEKLAGAQMRRTVRRLTAGVAGSAVVAAAVLTGTLMYNGDQAAAAADSTDGTGSSGQPATVSDDTAPDAITPGDTQEQGGTAAPVAPFQPPTVGRGGGHASSGGS